MTIRHHIDEALLMAYAAGSLPEAFGLVVATHLTLCDECRARAAALEALGGAVIEDCAPQTLGDEVEALALARILALPQLEAPAAPAARAASGRTAGEVPVPLADYIGRDFAAIRWRPVGLGVRQAILRTDREASARLLHIPAGAAMPDHGHHGLEMTLVLKGAFLDEGRRYGPGDVEIADAATEHRPVAEEWGDCLCLAASDQKLRFTGLLPRLAQPFFRI